MKTPVRIYHYDIARGAYLTPEYFVKAIRRAADAGFTHFLPYLENMLRLPSMEKACPRAAYTARDWTGFEGAAAQAGIELVPHFSIIGHMDAICRAYPALAGPGGGSVLDPTAPEVPSWTARCLDELCAISSGAYVLIGGDEWQAPRRLLASPDFNVARIWADQINRACACLVARGRTPVVWHDMLAHYPQAFDWVSREAVIAFWFYDEDSDYSFLEMLKARGFKTIMAAGTGNGFLSHRVKRAVDCAMKASDDHAVDGFMMTCWEDGRWEKLSLIMPAMGALFRGERVPDALVDAASVADTLRKVPDGSRFAQTCRSRLTALLCDPAWAPYPECHDYLTSVATGDLDRERTSFLRYHAPEGPLLAAIDARRQARELVCCPQGAHRDSAPGPAPRPGLGKRSGEFRLTIEEKALEGPILRFVNGDETFAIYPRFGGSLQDWRVGPATIIPHSLPGFLQRGVVLPGGYGSYTGVGGFRPVWGLGTHSNPCILWQGPFEWETGKGSADRLVVELRRRMSHVDVRYTVTVCRDVAGFMFRADAVNHLDDAYGALNFNLVLAMEPQDIEETVFMWSESGREHRLRLSEQFDSFFRLPAAEELTVAKPAFAVRIGCDPAKTAGFYVDWATSFLTPDIRGFYKPLQRGDCATAEWRFAATAVGTAHGKNG